MSRTQTATKVVQALDSGFTQYPSKQPSSPPTYWGIRALSSGRQIGRETDLKKVFWRSSRTAINSSGKRDLAAMAEADEPKGPVATEEPPRQGAAVCQ